MTLKDQFRIARQVLHLHEHMDSQIFDNPWPVKRAIEAKLTVDSRLRETPLDMQRAVELNPEIVK